MEYKQMKLDAEAARLEAYRRERILKSDRHSERNSKRVLSSKISRSQNAFMKLLKTEGHVSIPKFYDEAMASPE
ncbi:putative mitosis protein dim1 [Golovinomyces cichoracearum]|uniref:Putative mitosis protein dim1 n=1 Tax=Golovinomyces cichoracearum TaxID=62708 RepID=A0A420JC37_9PEZI|nr:putative mitosis protein dim1 [Golovinomyces cichoracearum]